jgi:hypothetical protein
MLKQTILEIEPICGNTAPHIAQLHRVKLWDICEGEEEIAWKEWS